jgi:hypothetical protein
MYSLETPSLYAAIATVTPSGEMAIECKVPSGGAIASLMRTGSMPAG